MGHGAKELSVGIQRVEDIQAWQKARARTSHRRQAGFTLIELLVVIIIIGLLAALVGPKLFGRVGKGKQAAAQAQIELFGAALDNFRLHLGRYPTSGEGLRALIVNPGGVQTWG